MSSVTNATSYWPLTTITTTTATTQQQQQQQILHAALSDVAHAAVVRAAVSEQHKQQQPQHQQPHVKPGVLQQRGNVFAHNARTIAYNQDIQVRPLSISCENINYSNNSPNVGNNRNHHYQPRFSLSTLPITRSCDKKEVEKVTPTRTTATTTMIEIAPGVSLPLRGAEETQQAIAAGFYVECECQACVPSSAGEHPPPLHCILDCDYFLCPDCRSVAPNPLKAEDGGDTTSSGGLGMGFRLQLQQPHH